MSMKGYRQTEAGLTLTEVLVALMIFATIGSVAMGLLTSALTARDVHEQTMEQVSTIQTMRTLLRDDISQVVMRPYRSEEGLTQPLVFAGNIEGTDPFVRLTSAGAREVLVLTRRGWDNPGHIQNRSSLLRISWIYDGSTLKRRVWPYPDTTQDTEPVTMTLLSDVDDLELEFLWGQSWSRDVRIPVSESGTRLAGPSAVRVTYTLPGLGSMTHVILTPYMEASS